MRIQIKRRGGLSGVRLCTDVETSEFDRETAVRVEDAIGRLLETAPTASAPHPDMFEYEIRVPERGQAVRVSEHELPDELRPAIKMLSQRGVIEGAHKRPT